MILELARRRFSISLRMNSYEFLICSTDFKIYARYTAPYYTADCSSSVEQDYQVTAGNIANFSFRVWGDEA